MSPRVAARGLASEPRPHAPWTHPNACDRGANINEKTTGRPRASTKVEVESPAAEVDQYKPEDYRRAASSVLTDLLNLAESARDNFAKVVAYAIHLDSEIEREKIPGSVDTSAERRREFTLAAGEVMACLETLVDGEGAELAALLEGGRK